MLLYIIKNFCQAEVKDGYWFYLEILYYNYVYIITIINMAKKTKWDQIEKCDEKVCSGKCEKKCMKKEDEKILISKEALDDWRVTKNELIQELGDLYLAFDELMWNFWELALKLEDVKFVRNISIFLNIALIVIIFLIA